MRCFAKVLTVSWCLLFASLLGAPTAIAADGGRTASPAKVSPSHQTASSQENAAERYRDLPLSFEPNQGQLDGQVRFVSRGSGYSFFLTQAGAVLSFSRDPHSDAVLRMQLAGANPNTRIEGLDELPGKSNYFAGSDASRWRTGVPTYSRVKYENVYPGISLVYYGNQRQLEYDFVVAPGADPRQIRLSIAGAQKLTVDSQGNLVLHNAAGEVQLLAPRVYQQIKGQNQEVAGQWTLAANNIAAFRLGEYDRTQPLVIDPVLMYSSFLGGSQKNVLSKIAIDDAGNAYVAGYTASGDFPAAPTPLATTFGAGAQSRGAFVAKIDPSGSNLLYSTYLSGSSDEEATGLAVDKSGNVYVAGNTHSIDFPTRNALQSTCATHTQAGTCSSAFLTKISPTGDSLLFATYLGGSGGESARGLAIDASGSAYLAGVTSSLDFPVTSGAAQTKCGGSCQQNAFVAKFSPAGDKLAYATYLGGSAVDDAADLAVDASGNAYLAGKTTSADFPLATPYQKSCTPDAASTSAACLATAFVAKIKSDGSAFAYSTYLGGSLGSQASAIAVDSLGSAFVTGSTQSADFPVLKPFQKTCGLVASSGKCSVDAFVTKFAPAGKTLIYSTYLGGSGRDEPSGIVVDAAGNAHVVGRTESADFPTVASVQSKLKGTSDAFAARLNSAGSALTFSTYHGGSATESGNGIALDAKGNLYLAGETSSNDFPTSHPFQSSCAGACTSAFVTKMSLPPAGVTVAITPNPAVVELANAVDLSALVTGNADVTVAWTLTGTCTVGCGTLSAITTTTVTYTAPAVVPTGTVSVTATANADGTTTDVAPVDLTGFKLAVSPASVDVGQSSSTTATLTASALNANGYTGILTPSCTGLPTGVTCAFSPTTISLPGTGTSTITINTTGAATAGAHTITVSAVDGATVPATRTTTFNLNVVTVAINPATATVEVGTSQTFTPTVVPAQNVTWTLTGANCSGAACGSVTPTTTASGTATTYTAPATAPLGTVTLTATTTGNVTGTATITPTDFAVSVNPTFGDVAPGANATTTLTATAFNANGYTGTLTPSCSGLPTGASCVFSPTTISLPGVGTSTVTVKTTSSTPAGSHNITISVVDGATPAVTRTAIFTLNVVTLTVSPLAPTVEVNNTQVFTGTVTPPRTINWALTGSVCTGAACGTLSSATGTTTTYTAPATVPTGTVTLTASASGGFTGTASIAVSDFTVSLNPTAQDVTAGTSASTTLTAAAVNGYTGTLTPSCTGLPTGASCSFNPATLTVPGSLTSAVTISTTGATPPGLHNITVSAIDAATVKVTHTAPFALTVVSIAVAPAAPSVEVSNTQSFTGVVTGLTNTTINWSLTGSVCTGAACGTLSSATGSPVTYTAPATIPTGTVALVATANDNLTRSVPITLTDFTLAVAPATATAIQGLPATPSPVVTIGATNGYTGIVQPACTGAPAGVTCTANAVTNSGTSTVNISTTSSTAVNVYSMPIAATDSATNPVTHTKPFTLTVCSVSFSNTPPTAVNADGHSGTVTVTIVGGNCAWTASSDSPWLQITAGSSGSGSGTVSYSIANNYGAASAVRTGNLTIAGATFPITQQIVVVTGITPLTPPAIHVNSGSTIQFTAAATNTATTGVTWSETGNGCAPPACIGVATGIYQAPANIASSPAPHTSATDTISAASSVDPTKLSPSPLPAVSILNDAPSCAGAPGLLAASTNSDLSNVVVGLAHTCTDNPVEVDINNVSIAWAPGVTVSTPFSPTTSSASVSSSNTFTAAGNYPVTETVSDTSNATGTNTASAFVAITYLANDSNSLQVTAGSSNTQTLVSFPSPAPTITSFVFASGSSDPCVAATNSTGATVSGVIKSDGTTDASNFGITCSVSAGAPWVLTVNTSASTNTGTANAAKNLSARSMILSLGVPGFVFFGLCLVPLGRKRGRQRRRLLCLLGLCLVISALVFLPACGGGIDVKVNPLGTNTVTYFVTVTGVDGSGNQQTYIVPITVAPAQ